MRIVVLFLFLVSLCLALSSVRAGPTAPGASELLERGSRCSASDQCRRTQFCFQGQCRRKKADGQQCASYKSCCSGSCDAKKMVCASSHLTLGSRCTTSASCRSGNCQRSYCAPKKRNGQSCYKNSNCQSAHCDKSRGRCARIPAEHQPELQPSLPWNRDRRDLANLDPSPAVELYYLDSGALDLGATTQFFAKMNASLNWPAVVLSHSSFVGKVKCEGSDVSKTRGAGLEAPFSTEASYRYAKASWTKIAGAPWVLVTHTDGCGDADKPDERTFWLADANGLVWDDAAQTVDVRARQIAHQDVINVIDLNFGQGSPNGESGTGGQGGNSSSGGGTSPSLPGGSSGGDSSGPSGGNTSNGCGAAPSDRIDGLPAVSCGSNFDRALDDALGFVNLGNEDSFATEAAALAPGLSDYSVAQFEADGSKFDDNTKYSSELRRDHSRTRRHHARRHAELLLLQKRGVDWGKWARKLGTAVVKTVTAPVRLGIQAGAKLISETPLGPIVDRLLEAASPTIDKTMSLSIKPAKNLKPTKKWGNQFQIFEKTYDKENKKGQVGLYCVDCGIEGSAHLSGRLLFTVQNSGDIKEGWVHVVGGMKATAQLGLEAAGEYEYTNKKNLATAPLGGFAIKDYVVIGPSLALDAQFKFKVEAEGTLLVGAKYGIEKFQARLDLKAENAWTQSGFEPKFEKVFDIEGKLKTEAVLALPISVAFGVKITPAKFDKQIALSTEPGIGVSAEYAYNTTVPKGSLECNNGIAFELGIQNEVLMDFAGKRKPLGSPWKHALAKSCKRLGDDPGTPKEGEGAAENPGSHETNGQNSGSDSNGNGAGDESEEKSSSPGTDSADSGNEEKASTGKTPSVQEENAGAASGHTAKRQAASNEGTLNYDLTSEDLNFSDDQLSEESKAELASDIAESMAAAEAAGTQDGFEYVQLTDLTKKYHLAANDDGTLTLVDIGAKTGGLYFAVTDRIVVTDDSDNAILYFPETMQKYGVSRLRMLDYHAIPKTSDMAVLIPVNDDQSEASPGIYVARPTQGDDIFYTMMCNFADGRASKFFLAKDYKTAAATLKQEKLRYTVTGGVVTDCQFVPFTTNGFAGF